MKRADHQALQRCLAIALRGPRAQWYRAKLAKDGWPETAHCACWQLQVHTLGLRPWQIPPSAVGDEREPPQQRYGNDELAAAWELRRRLRDHGISPYHHDPKRALDEAIAARRDDLRAVATEPPPEAA